MPDLVIPALRLTESSCPYGLRWLRRSLPR